MLKIGDLIVLENTSMIGFIVSEYNENYFNVIFDNEPMYSQAYIKTRLIPIEQFIDELRMRANKLVAERVDAG